MINSSILGRYFFGAFSNAALHREQQNRTSRPACAGSPVPVMIRTVPPSWGIFSPLTAQTSRRYGAPIIFCGAGVA